MQGSDKYLKLRGRRWYYIRRVPKKVAHLDQRGKIELSLETSSLEEACARRDALAEADRLYWLSLHGGGEAVLDVADANYKAAQHRALALGFVFKPAYELEAAPVVDVVARALALVRRPEAGLQSDAQALLGTAKRPSVTVSKAMDVYLAEIAPDEQKGMSAAQKKSYEKVKNRAVSNFIKIVGDIDLEEVTREDALQFFNWWQDRVTGKGGEKPLSGNSANRDVGNMRKLYSSYFERVGEEERENPFRNLNFRSPKALRQDVPPFPASWIQQKILEPGALASLNRDAALIVLACIETGCRPSELCNISAQQIYLDAKVPYISIKFKPDRAIKTESSVRDIPLIGVSYEAMRRAPEGFPRYVDKENNFSATAMKAFRRAGLLPSENHRIYSLRHAFETRMKEAKLDYELRCLLMGHAIDRPEYGDGGSMAYRAGELRKIQLGFSMEVFERLRGK
ncbi:DUF6538 domain-containing protein [Pseudovibrio sp. Ad37]|uniref:DUF6538 domain-containing protein n=1 Tax=Pseudovibrio sp. Ad37 TaxID=989422 RepID=UPI0007AEAE2D|nr:DUF6538 domain-containing protein [Pseudovibrio sp. Ad37]KZL15135.1 Phage integrase family protein [Pseudovibrio sp. Ad37]